MSSNSPILPILTVQKLTAGYDRASPILKDLNFTLSAGERVALIGANGAGKTTLLLALLGLVATYRGTITAAGIELNRKSLAAIRQNVGMLFQNPDDQLFMPTVAEDVAFAPRNYGLSAEEISARVDTALARLQISALRDRFTHQLSGGEKRLTALAGVLTMSPQVLLLDEPSSFLDPRARRNLTAVLKSLPQTLLIATHDFSLAAEICSRVIVMKDGEIFAAAPTEEFLGKPDLLVAAGL